MFEVISLMILALVLGFKHSYDSDHLIAVSNILRKVNSVKSSINVGLSWAIGHMMTATIITIILFVFKEPLLASVLPHFEKIVGVLLIALGIFSLKDFLMFHSHRHSHGNLVHSHNHIHVKNHLSQTRWHIAYRKLSAWFLSMLENIPQFNGISDLHPSVKDMRVYFRHIKKNKTHSHAHMFGIGIIHGLASNDELLILFTASLAITSIGSLILALGMFSLGVVAGMILFAAIFTYPLIKMHSEKIYRLMSLGTGSIGIFYGILMLFAVV